MRLLDYLRQLEPKPRKAFAKRCGTSLGSLMNVAHGFRPCRERLAIEIEKNSVGAVTCEELRDDVDWAYLRGTAARHPKTAANA
jgi:DNA-binding transcriptional regulator YdaS (Cro superfamily)